MGLSAAFVNGQRLMPGDRGVRLQPGDVVELGVHPNRTNVGKALRIVVAAAEDDAPSHIEVALRAYASSPKPLAKNGGRLTRLVSRGDGLFMVGAQAELLLPKGG